MPHCQVIDVDDSYSDSGGEIIHECVCTCVYVSVCACVVYGWDRETCGYAKATVQRNNTAGDACILTVVSLEHPPAPRVSSTVASQALWKLLKSGKFSRQMLNEIA